MGRTYTEGESFEGRLFDRSNPLKGEYENCTFRGCKFASCDFYDIIFVECEFQECDFSMANLKSASFRDVRFVRSKMLGLRFDECNSLLLSFAFVGCILNYSSYHKLKLKGTLFKECKLEEVDFTESDLTNVKFEHCDLIRTTFENTVLNGADFRTATNYSIDPEKNQLKKARFSFPSVAGLLDKYGIIIE